MNRRYLLLISMFSAWTVLAKDAQPERLYDVSCHHFEANKLSSCSHRIKVNTLQKQSFEDLCVKSEGKIEAYLCPLDNTLGECNVINDNDKFKESIFHYKLWHIKDQADIVSKSCELAKGEWEKVDIERELLSEMKEAYIHRFDKKPPPVEEEKINSLFEQINKMLSYTLSKFLFWKRSKTDNPDSKREYPLEWKEIQKAYSDYRAKHSKETAEQNATHPEWFDPYKVQTHREIFNRLTTGGCGTLASFLCANTIKSEKISLEEIDETYRHSPSTSFDKRSKFYTDKGLCYYNYLPEISALGCQSYINAKKWMDHGCQMELVMRTDTGHVEFVRDIYHSKQLNFCYGISNSWGTPAIFKGGSGTFFHGTFSMFNGAKFVYFRPVCPCEKESFELARQDAIQFLNEKKSVEAMDIYAILAKHGYATQEAEDLAYESLKTYTGFDQVRTLFHLLFADKKRAKNARELSKTMPNYQKSIVYASLLRHGELDYHEAELFAETLLKKGDSNSLRFSLILFVELTKIEADPQKLTHYESIARTHIHEEWPQQIYALDILTELVKKHFVFAPLWDDLNKISDQAKFYMVSGRFYSLIVQLIKEFGDSPEALAFAQKRIKNGTNIEKELSLQVFSEFVRQKLRYNEALQAVKETIENPDNDVNIPAKILLLQLIEAKHEKSIRFAKKFANGIRAWVSGKDFYFLEIEKILKK